MVDTFIGTASGVFPLSDVGGRTRLAGSYGNGMCRSKDVGVMWSPSNVGRRALPRARPACAVTSGV